MKILVIGSGGREHALVWKFAQSPLVTEILAAPGNAGTAMEPKARNLAVGASDLDGLLNLAQSERVDLTVVGPEQPLVDGVVDRFEAAGLKCFGPQATAARLEGSKAFTKAFLARHNIPTAAYETFAEPDAALEYIGFRTLPIVIKADGLAAGKGVIIAETFEEAERTVRGMLEQRTFGDAGATVVVEDFLRGEEASFIAVVDDTRIVPLASSQDHKTRDEGDRGPNTGGMGAYSPAPVLTPELHRRVMDEIMIPTVTGMSAEGMAYRGFLYAGLMIDPDGKPRVLEYNCRFGDPETQPVLARMRSDLTELCLAAFDGSLDSIEVEWDPRASLGVVLASGGYPGSYATGTPISGLDANFGDDTLVFHAGTREDDGNIVTSGGRVLCVVGLGDTVASAAELAYSSAARIHWKDVYYRRDIGYRAIQRERNSN
ncbi:MAG: phosphoribosylamine--glycine ligase [Proteobacteria bacterium]|nr:phosphoribosylamine--glycine ligase [Pseudomonadota bacterium]MYJ95250.1 phosphoribosylamine--glycine ligase [Pseudomonadota bacterium]